MKSSTFLPGLMAGILSTALMTNWVPADAADETVKTWRLFVTDQTEGRVTAIDTASGKILGVFPTSGYVSHLVPSDSQATLFAIQMDHDMVNVIDTGIRFSGHGDHSDIKINDTSMLPVKLAGQRPVHMVPHGDQVIQFYDREGAARTFSEKALLKGDTTHKTFKLAAPVHGIALQMGDYMLVSEPDLKAETKPGDLLPRLGLSIYDQAGNRVGETATCTGLHGEASSAGTVAFGCAEGVLLAKPKADGIPGLSMLTYTQNMQEGRVGTLLGGRAMEFFLGNYGDDRVVIIETSGNMPFRIVDLPLRRVDFALDPILTTTAYIFTEDGQLHALDILTGKLTRSAGITRPYSKDGHWRDPRPRLAVMGDMIAITDPHAQLVRLIDAESFKEVRTIPVEGLPFNIVAIGGSGLQH